jgi:hypothetical protein
LGGVNGWGWEYTGQSLKKDNTAISTSNKIKIYGGERGNVKGNSRTYRRGSSSGT